MTTIPVRPKHIVVGVDGSAGSRLALCWAEHMAALDDARIDAVMVRQPLKSYADPRAVTQRLLADTIRQTFPGDGPPRLRLRVVDGHPGEELVARSTGASLVVVGSRGHGGVVGRLLGSVSAQCVEQAQCAVLVAHCGAPDSNAALRSYTRVVVGVDGSATSRAALRWAAGYSRRTRAHVEAVLVWTDADVFAERFGPQRPGLTTQESMDRWLTALVDDVLGPERRAQLRLVTERGSTATVLLRRSHQAGLLVLGTRGYHGIENLALGSVSARCASQARCSVVVVHDPSELRPDSSEVA